MIKKTCIVFILSFFMLGNVLADIIILKSGERVDAKIIERDNEKVVVDISGIKVPYFLADIQKINDQAIGTVKTEEPVVKPPVAQNLSPVQPASPAVKESVTNDAGTAAASTPSAGTPVNNAAMMAATGIAYGIVLLIMLIIYVYTAICLYFIAKKTGHGPSWWAWVPVANVLLMLKIGGLSYWWALSILAAFIPGIIGMVAFSAFSAFFWYKIALTRNKPGWLGFLTFLPLINFVIIGYLAFSS